MYHDALSKLVGLFTIVVEENHKCQCKRHRAKGGNEKKSKNASISLVHHILWEERFTLRDLTFVGAHCRISELQDVLSMVFDEE